MSLRDILDRETHHAIVMGFVDFEYGSRLYKQLYEFYLPEMPYGVAKARDGDPDQWIFNRLCEEF